MRLRQQAFEDAAERDRLIAKCERSVDLKSLVDPVSFDLARRREELKAAEVRLQETGQRWPQYLRHESCTLQAELQALTLKHERLGTETATGQEFMAEKAKSFPKSPLGAFNLRKHTSKSARKKRETDGAVKDYESQRRSLQSRVDALKGRIKILEHNSVTTADLVRSLLLQLRGDSSDFGDEAREKDETDAAYAERMKMINLIRKASQPSTVMGGMIDVYLERSKDGKMSSQFPPILINFALQLHAYSPKAYNLVRGVMNNNLPSLATLARHNSLGGPVAYGCTDKHVISLCINADAQGISLSTLLAYIMCDEVNLLGVRAYRNRTRNPAQSF